MINSIRVFLYLSPFLCCTQTLTGKVIDQLSKAPIETASVYFDNTTIGTTTNENGSFSISYSDAVQSTLVISYLGYEKVFILDYRQKESILIELVEATNILDEVYLEYDDGLSRRQKLGLFRKEFLGVSRYGRSCKILNEDDLFLRYNEQEKALYATSKVPLRIENTLLQYELAYDIIDFELLFGYVNVSANTFKTKSIVYTGTVFFKDLENATGKRTLKHREKVYKGSVQHFMRALYSLNLEAQGYAIFYDNFKVDESEYFKVSDLENSNIKKVSLSQSITILYDKEWQSKLQLNTDAFFVDAYGNYSPIPSVLFGGAMGDQRIGDSLPSGYGIEE